MKIPLEWLKEYVTVRLSPEALAERLTMTGLEVTGIERVNGQPVFDFEITPNRADCLSILGIAREVAAITGQRLKLPPMRQETGDRRQVDKRKASLTSPVPRLSIKIEDRKGCIRYIGRLLDGVRIASSPDWMQRRLIACGIRPINNVVDITNYVLFEYGQPLHAFNFKRLEQGTILVRRARPNETITTLDGIKRTLSSEMLVIADGRHAVAVAGVMGGVGSEVTQQTTAVLLESALFDPITVRRTARALGLTSESSYRFERGVDPVGVEQASMRAASLIRELAGGAERAVCDVGARPAKRSVIVLEANRVARWLGTPISPSTIRTTLARLSCHVASAGAGEIVHVIPPSFRRDLLQDVDLYEELARVIGYEHLPARLPIAPLVTGSSETSVQYWRIQSLGCLCASLGLTETLNWALVSEADLARIAHPSAHAVRLANPLSQDHAYLRPSLLIGLLQSVRRNLTQGAAGVRMFELGHVVRPTDGLSGAERLSLGIALSGTWLRDWRTRAPCDFFTLKGIVQALIGRLCEGSVSFATARHPWAESGQSAAVQLNDREIGTVGEVSRAITHNLDIEQGVWVAELSVEELLAAKCSTRSIHPLSVVPPVKRDLSIIVSDDVQFSLVDRTIREVGGSLASQVELIDRYSGPQVPQGKHSLTFSIEYRDPARTLTATEVDALHQRIGHALISRAGAALR